MQYILKSSAVYYGLSIVELRSLAYEYAKKIEIDYPSTWNEKRMAGWDWYYSFMKRHRNLSLRTPEQTSLARAKAFSKANVNTFFANLNSVLTEKVFEPHRIWNMDETGFPTVATKTIKVLAAKGTKCVGQIASQERGTNVSMALAVSASGASIPPCFLFPRKNMRPTFLDNAIPGSIGFANESGYMKKPEFEKYMEHFIKHSNATMEAPTLLLLDNHSSHLSVNAIDMAVNHGITMLSFPPHCSHRLQPLDVSVFGPVKKFYVSQSDAWLKNNAGRVLEICHVPSIVDKCLDLGATPKNIKGFSSDWCVPIQS